ncbi:MAG TPA: hypothetical protein VGF79_03490 [Bacteroidia bacterium]
MCVNFNHILVLLILPLFFTEGCSSAETPLKAQSGIESDTLIWVYEMCNKCGTFDAKKHNKTELINIRNLMDMGFSGLTFQTKSRVFDYKNICSLDSFALEQEYNSLKNKIQSMKIIEKPIWIKLRQMSLDALQEEYNIKRTEMMAYKYPEVLLSHPYSAGCPELAEILYNQDTNRILEAWKNQVIEQAKTNSNPQGLIDQFALKNSLPERVEIAKTELITFGWPCKDRIHNLSANTLYQEAFDRLFLSIESDCF